jgi:hypothetical protein
MNDRQATDGVRALRSYLDTNGLSITAFCARNGLDRIQVLRVLNGERRRISVDFALSIERATGGAVQTSLWSSATAKPTEASSIADDPTTPSAAA